MMDRNINDLKVGKKNWKNIINVNKERGREQKKGKQRQRQTY